LAGCAFFPKGPGALVHSGDCRGCAPPEPKEPRPRWATGALHLTLLTRCAVADPPPLFVLAREDFTVTGVYVDLLDSFLARYLDVK